MIEFTPERIENIRWAIKTKAEVQTVSPLTIEMLDEITRLQSRVQELEAEQRWIPVSERLPEEEQEALVSYGDGKWVMSAYRHDGKWYDIPYDSPIDPTHWRPLPQPPKDGE